MRSLTLVLAAECIRSLDQRVPPVADAAELQVARDDDDEDRCFQCAPQPLAQRRNDGDGQM